MEAMVERNMFTGYSVGEYAPVSVSHLQFADYTLLMGTKSWANVRALRAVLVLSESMSGLRVNFHKSMLVGVNIPDSWLGRYGVEGGRLCEGGARGSTWWRELARIRDGE
ncbi:cytochrome p450, partial [Trifolium pratense]